MGFVAPTPIQEQAIPYLIQSAGGDLVGLAQTGTGKTAAFGLPMLNKIDEKSKKVQGLIICPTRELCLQISRDLENFGKKMRGLSVVAVYGGTDITKQIRSIDKGAQIVVATPGRLIDLIYRKKVKLGQVESVVLDEADEMLNMGFKEDIDTILEETPAGKDVWLFSATMPKEVERIAKNYMTDPFSITVGHKNHSNENIEHIYYSVKERDRYDALKRLIDVHPEIFGLVFCRTKRETQMVADNLGKEGYSVEPLHGDMSQSQRDRTMERFREKSIQLLVATDVAARGIDVNNITHVINYNLPDDTENYTHRSGRTARAGNKGQSLVLVNTKQHGRIRQIERVIGRKFDKGEIPQPNDICEKQLFSVITKMKNIEVNQEDIAPYLPKIMEELSSIDKEELITMFVSAEFNRFIEYYKGAKDLNAAANDRGGDRDRDDRRGSRRDNDENSERYFVNIGKKDGLNTGALVRLVCDATGLTGADVGRIDVLDTFSFFETPKEHSETVLDKVNDSDFDGNPISVEITKKRQGGGGGRDRRSGGGGGGRSSGGYRGNGGGDRRSGGGGGSRGSYGGDRRSSGGGDRRSSGGSDRSSGGGSGYGGRSRSEGSSSERSTDSSGGFSRGKKRRRY
jgi:ATP-dependent RNA helicase DeaD